MVGQQNFSPFSFGVLVGSRIRDPGLEIWDQGSRMEKNQDLSFAIPPKHFGKSS
jgi:hypothetical protein